MKALKAKTAPLYENVGEAGLACLITMVQGNLFLIGIGHWFIAAQTGLISGALTTAALTFSKTTNRWGIAAIIGVTTAVVDVFVHRGMLGEWFATEAVVTGTGAAALTLLVGFLSTRIPEWRAALRTAAPSPLPLSPSATRRSDTAEPTVSPQR